MDIDEMHMMVEEDNAAIRLMMCIKIGDGLLIKEEVERRAILFKNKWDSELSGHTMTTKHAALDSVYQDVIRGYL